jgi:lysophospholipase L1-like esterase
MRIIPSLFVIGDSHSNVFKFSSLFRVIYIGPATAHNLIKKKSSTGSSQKIQKIIKMLKKGDILILVFGEIDCRIHIYYQFKKNQGKTSISELIDTTIQNYGKCLKTIQGQGIEICVCGITPVGNERNIYNYLFYAERSIQSSIYQEFNRKLKSYCDLSGIQFLNIYPIVSDEEGLILKDYSDDGVHLNKKILPKIENMLYSKYGVKLRIRKIISQYWNK